MGFRENNPITPETYAAVLGEYKFGEARYQRCCAVHDGKHLCRQRHGWGYVVVLRDRSVSIIGNCCATKDGFRANEALQDHLRFLRQEVQRQEAVASAQRLISKRAERLRSIDDASVRLDRMETDLAPFVDSAGPSVIARLVEMSRAGRRTIDVALATIRGEGDDTETTFSTYSPPSIRGIDAIDKRNRTRLRKDLREARKLVSARESLPDSAPRKVALKVAEELTGVEGRVEEVARLEDATRGFLTNDFLSFCFLARDRYSRRELARFAYEQKGEQLGLGASERRFEEHEKKVVEAHRATYIRY